MKKPQYNVMVTALDAFEYYKRSEADDALQSLLDRINRVPMEPTEAMAKGTAFNEVIDLALEGNLPEPKDGIITHSHFAFNSKLVTDISDYFEQYAPQVLTSAIIDCKGGAVNLYGYVDYIRAFRAADLKTTGKYDFPKYIDNWQHRAYTWMLRENGLGIDEFTYLITDFSNIYKEDYAWNRRYVGEVKNIVEEFIDFLEVNREKITDLKVFNQHEVKA